MTLVGVFNILLILSIGAIIKLFMLRRKGLPAYKWSIIGNLSLAAAFAVNLYAFEHKSNTETALYGLGIFICLASVAGYVYTLYKNKK